MVTKNEINKLNINKKEKQLTHSGNKVLRQNYERQISVPCGVEWVISECSVYCSDSCLGIQDLSMHC